MREREKEREANLGSSCCNYREYMYVYYETVRKSLGFRFFNLGLNWRLGAVGCSLMQFDGCQRHTRGAGVRVCRESEYVCKYMYIHIYIYIYTNIYIYIYIYI